VRRDTGEKYEEFPTRLAQESGIETPTREQSAKLDRKGAKKGSNNDWTHPHDPDARITKMKDARSGQGRRCCRRRRRKPLTASTAVLPSRG
jgi:transposase